MFSIFGVFWLFWLTGTTYSIMASIGVLILMGVVVNNGIVMIVHINQLRHQGLLRREALIQGAKDRLRPILMTMGTAILGMVPLCISNASIGGDGPPYYPMARAIAGGLVFSTLVSVLVLPTHLFAARRRQSVGQAHRARVGCRRASQADAGDLIREGCRSRFAWRVRNAHPDSASPTAPSANHSRISDVNSVSAF